MSSVGSVRQLETPLVAADSTSWSACNRSAGQDLRDSLAHVTGVPSKQPEKRYPQNRRPTGRLG